MADLTSDLKAALLATTEHLSTVIRQVVRDELAAFRQHGDPDALLDAEDAARLLGMTPTALRRAAERGRFPVPPVRLGRRLRWRRGNLLQLLASSPAEKASISRRSKASISASPETCGDRDSRGPADRRDPQAPECPIHRRVEPT